MNTNVTTIRGVDMPRMLYGTAWKTDRTADLVAQAIKQGFRGIDTACQPKHYHEPGAGAGVAVAGVARNELYLQTKFTTLSGQDPARLPYDRDAPLAQQVAQSVAASLSNLRTDYIDALVLHSPPSRANDLDEIWHAMEASIDRGAVRELGISNCYQLQQFEALYRKARIKPAILQNRFYADTGYDRELRAFCRDHGIVYQSFWTLTANPALLADKIIRQSAAHFARTPAQILFRYLTHMDVVPLTGTSSVTHMQEDLAIFDFELSAADCARIERLLVR